MPTNVLMYLQTFTDIRNKRDDQTWTWQQDGTRAHKARASDQFLQQSTPNFIDPDDWPSKSPDLNVDYTAAGAWHYKSSRTVNVTHTLLMI